MSKVSKKTVVGTSNLQNVSKINKVTCPKLIKVISNLFDYEVKPAT